MVVLENGWRIRLWKEFGAKMMKHECIFARENRQSVSVGEESENKVRNLKSSILGVFIP